MFRKKVKAKRASNSYVNIISKKLSLLKPFNYFILIKLFHHNYAQTVMKKPFLRIAAIKIKTHYQQYIKLCFLFTYFCFHHTCLSRCYMSNTYILPDYFVFILFILNHTDDLYRKTTTIKKQCTY